MRGETQNGNIHPRRLFKDEVDIKNIWSEYKAHRKEQSSEWPIVQFVGKDAKKKVINPVLPLTMDGFYVFVREKVGEIEQYFTNQDGYYDDFIGICRAIKQEVRDQQITGGMLNQFNSSITQRINNLTEKIEVSDKTPIIMRDGEELPDD